MFAVFIFSGPFGLTKEILQQEGIRGLYKGLTATFMREIPGYVFFFGGYEISRHLLTPAGQTKDTIGKILMAIRHSFMMIMQGHSTRILGRSCLPLDC